MTSGARYDAVVIGSGSGGRGCARRLNEAGLRVAMLEGELVGGECPFWACIPSKALLRPVEVVSEARHTPGVAEPRVDWGQVAAYRDYMNSALDDSKKFETYSGQGIEIIRGRGRIVQPGVVGVDDRRLETDRIIVATGSAAAVPDIDGLDRVEYWTNREATSFAEVPGSAVVLGGGPVGIELGQMLSRYGCSVTIVEADGRLLSREHPKVGALVHEALRREPIEVRTGIQAERVATRDGLIEVRLSDGDRVRCERLVVATGRRPRTEGLGLEEVGVRCTERGIEVDACCRAAPGVWAVGDVTGIAPFTHVAAYQARVAVADILGRPAPADYRAIPRVVFCDPEVAAVGMTPAQAAKAGIETHEATLELSEVDRTETYGRDLMGEVGLLADARRKVLLGAWAVGPMAGEWIHTAVLAVKAELPVAVLRDTIVQFPTFSEALTMAAERLPD